MFPSCTSVAGVCEVRFRRYRWGETIFTDHLFLCFAAVPVWLEYVQYSIGGMGEEGGVQHIRQVFEQALTAAGLHVSKGAALWEAYREFESAILAGLQVLNYKQEYIYRLLNFRILIIFKYNQNFDYISEFWLSYEF